MEIKIGSDELILWLRKNNKAVNIPNDNLGNDISKLIQENYNGVIIEYDKPAYWQTDDGSKNIGANNLPKTSAQYTIDTKYLPDLFETMNNW